jgi:thermostable 8-oxoguanine DNA glycosylase
MNKEEFLKLVNQELDWLRYYAYDESRKKLNIDSNIYDDLISIGYTKRNLPLYKRCAPCILTSNEKITKTTNIEDLFVEYSLRSNENNLFTPLEIFWIKYPNRRKEIIINLNSEQSKVKQIKN